MEFVNEHIPHVAEAFELCGNGTFTKDDIETLQNHRSMAYIIAEGDHLSKFLKL